MPWRANIEYVRAWDNGWRHFLAIEGYTWITLIDHGTLKVRRVRAKTYREMKPKRRPEVPLERVLERLRLRSDEWVKLGCYHPRARLLTLLERAKKWLSKSN